MPFKLYIRLLSQFVDNGMQIDLMENSCGPNDHLTFWRNCLSVLFHLPLAKKSREMSREHFTQPIELYTEEVRWQQCHAHQLNKTVGLMFTGWLFLIL